MLGSKVHNSDDTALLIQMREGMRSAFDSLYEKYKKDVFNEAYKRLNDADQAKDITQDVFTALWINGSRKAIDNLPGYLYVAIKNNVYRLIQRQEKFVPIPDLLLELHSDKEHADAEILYNELVNAYEDLVGSLPEQQRIIYKMRFDDQLNPDEIAATLNLSPKTVRNHLGRAITRLRTAFLLIQLVFLFVGKH